MEALRGRFELVRAPDASRYLSSFRRGGFVGSQLRILGVSRYPPTSDCTGGRFSHALIHEKKGLYVASGDPECPRRVGEYVVGRPEWRSSVAASCNSKLNATKSCTARTRPDSTPLPGRGRVSRVGFPARNRQRVGRGRSITAAVRSSTSSSRS